MVEQQINTKRSNLKRKENDMGKMSEIAMMLENGDEKGLVEFFGKQGWRKPVAKIGGKEFIKAFDEIKEAKKKTKEYVRISDINKEIAKEWKNK
mgnify:FL=1